jgi:putative radical SAM enzyme (TIGR03279 family)
MSPVIIGIEKGSPAAGRRLRPGLSLVRINGHKIGDVLDYKFHAYDARVLLELRDEAGKLLFVRINKGEGEELGLLFDSYLMDKPRSCANKCVFCFVDQLPEGLRESLYFKDDDNRLSFLQGNYVTLTNLSDAELRRMIDLRLSPLNISVHATDPALHSLLLGNEKSFRALKALNNFRAAGMAMNCQIVVCPGLNDGAQLERTMNDLAAMAPAVKSVSIVPVGLTRFRKGLCELRPFDGELARETVRQVEKYGEKCMRKLGTRLFYPADELYLKAGLDIPADRFYEGYPQLENGVGMLRLLMTQAEDALPMYQKSDGKAFSVATGEAAAHCLQKILDSAREICANINGTVYAVRNNFFGDMIDVAGLITGGDLMSQLKGKALGRRLLITKNMLRHGETVFLDNVTLDDVASALGVAVRVVGQDGEDLIRAIFGN